MTADEHLVLGAAREERRLRNRIRQPIACARRLHEDRIIDRPRPTIDERLYRGEAAAVIPTARIRTRADDRDSGGEQKDAARNACRNLRLVCAQHQFLR